MRNLLVLAVLLCSSLAQAQVVSPKMQRMKYNGTTGIVGCQESTTTTPGAGGTCYVLNAKPLNGTATSLTMLFNVRGYSTLGCSINYTYAAATSVVVTPSVSRDNGSTYAVITQNNSGGTLGALAAYTDTLTGTSSANFSISYDTRTVDWVKLILSGGGSPTSGDLVTVECVAAVGQ